MLSNKIKRLSNVGTSREGRTFPALDFDYVKIDERSFEDLLVFAGNFSKLINFYNHKNKADGNWSDFMTDESVVLAAIMDSNPTAAEIRFKKAIGKALSFKRREKKVYYLKQGILETFELASKFQIWFTKLKAIEVFTGESVAVKTEISSAISGKLKQSLNDLFFISQSLNQKLIEEEKLDLSFSRFEPIWELKISIADQSSDSELDFNLFSGLLQESFQSFYETLLYLKSKASDYFNRSLQSDTHYPEIALFLSFIKLFKHAQNNLNQLSQKHLEFYFSEVLKQKEKGYLKDKVYLSFSTYNTVPLSQIKKGALFLAGEDSNGVEILYQADNDLMVSKAKIGKLRTIHIPRKSINVKGKEKILFNNVLSCEIPIEKLVRSADDNRPRKTYATFGEDQQQKGVHEKTMDNALLGLAISSPNLFMKEGYREVSLKLTFSKSSFAILMEKLEDFSFVEKCPEEEIFVKSFLEAFHIDVSTQDGWYQVKGYVVSRNIKDHFLIIGFDLDNSDPSVTKYIKEIHGGSYQTHSPIVRVRLNSDSYIYPYSFLKDLELEEVEIKINVKGVKDLSLFNNMGQLNPDNPFYPFGSLPNKGSYLLIGSNEVLSKSLDDLKLNIEWFDLPGNSSGFYGHYEDYKSNIDNTSFEAKLSVLEEGRWKPASKEQQVLKLFRSEGNPTDERGMNPKSPVDELTSIEHIEINKIKSAPDYSGIQNALPQYTSTAQRGFIKLELSNPESGFGHTVYPAVLSEKAIKNSRAGMLKFGDKKMEKMPNPPYTPQIKSISIDYSSTSVITLKDRSNRITEEGFRGQIYHLHPFGQQLAYPDNSTQVTFFLPDYGFEGSLMIGIADLNPPQSLTMLFELFDEYTISSDEEPPVIEWSFLANNKWHYIKPSRILKDETSNFIRTGIIEIDLPYEINKNNTILDSNYYWIRATVIRNIEVASNIVSVYTQSLSATLHTEGEIPEAHLKRPLPAFTINRSVENIEGIETILQPLKSFGGRPKENRHSFYTRIAERLKHKNRAIMPSDYERLILDKFPQIYKVACLPNMTSENLDSPGSALIVICPYVTDEVLVNEPMASSELLYEIKNYVSTLISPFVKLTVRNPGYERIKIICSVKFTDGYNYGFFLQKLNEELKRYLSKSTASGSSGMNLGGRVNVSDILSFMRTLPYVEFITKFSMVQAARDFNGNWILVDTAREDDAKSYLEATKPWSVLVPATEHQITVLNEKLEERSIQAGIESLELGQDFIIE